MSVEISIICPVYNTEKFISKCINSVLNQTFKNFELLLVDDRGKDNAIHLAEKFKNKDERIKIIHHEKNKGVDQARFSGLEKAIGKYIMFIDSDDWLSENALEVLHTKIEEEKADVVFGSMVRVMDKFGVLKSKPKNNYSEQLFTTTITNPKLFDEYFISYFGVNKLMVSMWAKLYRKETIDKANSKPTFMKMGEDLIFNMKLHPFTTKMAFVPEVVYFYRFGGMTNSSNPSFLENIKEQYYLKQAAIEKYNYFKATPYIKYELINCFYSHFQNLMLLDGKNENQIKEMIIDELKDTIYNIESDSLTRNDKINFLLNKEVDKMLQLILMNVKAAKKTFLIKKIISNFLKNI